MSKLKISEDDVIQWKTQLSNLKTNKKVTVNLCLPEFISKTVMS